MGAGHLKSTSLPWGEKDAQLSAPKLVVAIQAKGKLPPDVNPVEPMRQFNKLHLMLHVFTRNDLHYFFSNRFYFRDSKLTLVALL